MNYPTTDDIFPLLQQAHNYGEYLSGLCPFHRDSSPSLLIDDKGFRCLACGKRGSLLALYRKLQGQPAPIALERRQRFSWREGAEIIWNKSYRCLQDNPGLSKYLRDRGLSNKTIEDCKIGYWQGWYIIPIFEAGAFQGAIARAGGVIESSCETYSNSPGPSKLYVPNQRFNDSFSYVLVPFGILDAISLYDCGFPAATWIAGKHVPDNAFDTIRKKIFILPDKDEDQDARRLASELGWRGQIIFLDYEKEKDPNDYLRNGRREQLIRQIRKVL